MKVYRAAVIGCLLLAMTSCTATASPPTRAGTAYTCCDAADVDREYQPGQTLTVQWIVVPGEPGVGGPVELHARLTGPYAAVSGLKSPSGKDAAGGATFTAETVRPAGQPGEQPVSVIQIPATAAPGLYNLVTSVTEQSGSHSGASVIRMVAKT
ncbi:hypothetical protein [Catellatospora vulcania]|uniref:hypothetical protein n=1 Tax=Catellatospora vulcania TaxID=1460450 RepID=UPI001E53E29E|nr:hypothetical protein [Catellatospora vulcania]